MDARKVEMKTIGDNEKLTYKELIVNICSVPSNPQAGMQLPEIRRCNHIIDKLETADGYAYLTPDEWTFLKTRIEGFSFRVGGKIVEQFADDIAGAELVELKEK